MRTVEEFTKIVREENQKHLEELLKMDNKNLIVHACEIAKWQAIYDYMEGKVIPYLEDEENEFEEFLMLEISNPITAICKYELNYSEPQWTSWDNLDDVVCGMFRTMKPTTKKIKKEIKTMLTTYKTAEQKYLFETYANEEGLITQKTVDKLSDMLSDDVYVRPEGESDYKTKATHAEKKFLAQLIGAGLWAIRDGENFYSVSSALKYMFVRWNSDNKGRHLNSYLTFYCPLARLCGRGEKVEL